MKQLYILAISMAAVMGCAPKKAQLIPEPELTVSQAQMREVPNVVSFVTQTQPSRSYVIQPRVVGYLRSINFRGGDKVKKGQLLFTIDPTQYNAQVSQARAALSSAKASLVQAEAQYNRSVPLAKINAISQSQLDDATASFTAAREQVASARAVLDNANLSLGYCRITAPEGGFIDEPEASVGDYVGAGSEYQMLTTISFDDSVSVDLSLPTVEYYRLVPPDSVSNFGSDSLLRHIYLRLSDGAVYPYPGVYYYTNAQVDAQSGSVVFNVRFPNKQGMLKGGQFARVSAAVGKAMQRVLVPSRAVNQVQGVYSVYVVGKDNKLEFRKVTLGDVVGSDWVVLSGVEQGEWVITEGFLKAKSGMRIKPLK